MASELRITCTTCFKTFTQLSSLKRHQASHSPQPGSLVECSLCQKCFKRMDALKRHEKSHRGEGETACRHCQRSFRKDYLSKHQRSCHAGRSAVFKIEKIAPTSRAIRKPEDDRQSERFQRTVLLMDSIKTRSQYTTEEYGLIESARQAINRRDLHQLETILRQLYRAAHAQTHNDFDVADYLSDLDQSIARPRRHTSRLHEAAELGNEVKMVICLASGLDINDEDDSRRTPLCIAAQNCKANAVEFLLRHGARVDGSLDAHDPPLCAVLRNGFEVVTKTRSPQHRKGLASVVKALLAAGADVQRPDSQAWTPLHYAAMNGSAWAVKVLLDKGANINMPNAHNETPLYWAVKMDREHATGWLLKNRARPDIYSEKTRQMPMHLACARGNEQIVRLLLAAGTNPELSVDGYTGLMAACEGGHIHIVEQLIASGVNVEQGCKAPLAIAIGRADSKIVSRLLQAGASVGRVPRSILPAPSLHYSNTKLKLL